MVALAAEADFCWCCPWPARERADGARSGLLRELLFEERWLVADDPPRVGEDGEDLDLLFEAPLPVLDEDDALALRPPFDVFDDLDFEDGEWDFLPGWVAMRSSGVGN